MTHYELQCRDAGSKKWKRLGGNKKSLRDALNDMGAYNAIDSFHGQDKRKYRLIKWVGEIVT